MGAIGLNGETAQAKEPAEPLRLLGAGWAAWPRQIAAIGVHGVGGVGVIIGNRSQLSRQGGATANTVVEFVITAAAAGASIWSGAVGAVVAEHADQVAEGVTVPSAGNEA